MNIIRSTDYVGIAATCLCQHSECSLFLKVCGYCIDYLLFWAFSHKLTLFFFSPYCMHFLSILKSMRKSPENKQPIDQYKSHWKTKWKNQIHRLIKLRIISFLSFLSMKWLVIPIFLYCNDNLCAVKFLFFKWKNCTKQTWPRN